MLRRAFIAGGAALSLPRCARASTPIDLFLAAGQSNDVGWSELSDAQAHSVTPAAGTAYQYAHGTLSPCVDPVYPSVTGSAWPAFAKTYNALTGRIVCIAGFAKGGTSQNNIGVDPSGTWDINDPNSLTPPAIVTAQAAAVCLAGAGYMPTYMGVLWNQGEADAAYINNSTETQWDYIAAFNAMRAMFLTQLGGRFFVFQTGSNSGDLAGTQSHYRAIRNAQSLCIAGDPNTFMVFTGAVDFPAAQSPALQQIPNSPHYMQRGYNRMGYIGAVNVAAITG